MSFFNLLQFFNLSHAKKASKAAYVKVYFWITNSMIHTSSVEFKCSNSIYNWERDFFVSLVFYFYFTYGDIIFFAKIKVACVKITI